MSRNFKDNIINLYYLTNKLVNIFEEEMDLLPLKNKDKKNNIIAAKNMTEALNKLVDLIIRLHKLSQELMILSLQEINEQDKMLIDEFVAKYGIKKSDT